MLNKIRCFKILQIFMDVLFFNLGLASILAHIITKSGKLNDPRLVLGEACLESDYAGFVKVFITWGTLIAVAVTLTSVLGLYSCVRQKGVLLYGYSMLGYVLCLLELLFFLTLYTHLGRVVQFSSACLKQALVQYYSGPFKSDLTSFSGVWDYLHRSQLCCGVDGGKVFNSMVTWNRTWLEKYRDPFFNTTLRLKEFKVITLLPYTCCRYKDESKGEYNPDATVADLAPLLMDEDCPSNPTKDNSYTHVSCLDHFSRFVGNMTLIVFSVSLVLEFLQLTAALGALYVSRTTMNRKLRNRMRKKGLIR